MVGSGTLVCTETGNWSPATFPQCIPISCIPQLLPPNVIVSPPTCQAKIPVGQTCTYSCSACSVQTYTGIPYASGTLPGSVGNFPGNIPGTPGSIPRMPANGFPGNVGNMPGTFGNMPGTFGNTRGTFGNMPGTPRNTPQMPVNGYPGNIGNIPGTFGNIPGTFGNMPRTRENTPQVPMNGFPGNVGSIPGTFENIPGTPGNTPQMPVNGYPGNVGNIPGTLGNMPGTPGNTPRMPVNGFPESVGNIPGAPGNIPGMQVNGLPGSRGNIPGMAGNQGNFPGVTGSVTGSLGVRAAQRTIPTTPVTATCQPNGSFDKQPPICRPIFCPKPVIPMALFSANCGTCGTECLMSCEGGYRLSSTTSGWPRCLDTGQWSGQFPSCIVGQSNPTIPRPIECPVIQPPLNGYWIEGTCGGRVTSCNAACYDCFDLENYQTARHSCVNGVWTPANVIARCLPTVSTCPDLRTVLGTAGGQVIGQCFNQCGTTCQYSCSLGRNIQTTKCTRQRFRETQGQTAFGQVTWNPRPLCQSFPPGQPYPPVGGVQQPYPGQQPYPRQEPYPGQQPYPRQEPYPGQQPYPRQEPYPVQPYSRQCTAEAPNKGFWSGCTGADNCNRCVRTAGQSCSLRCYDNYELILDGFQVTSIIFTCTNTGRWNDDPRNVRCAPRTTVPGTGRAQPQGPR